MMPFQVQLEDALLGPQRRGRGQNDEGRGDRDGKLFHEASMRQTASASSCRIRYNSSFSDLTLLW